MEIYSQNSYSVSKEFVGLLSFSEAFKKDGQVEMVVDVFRLEFPADFSLGPVEVNGDGHVAAVIVLFKEGGFMLLDMAFEDAGTFHL